MQKTKAKLPVLIISFAVISACFLHFFQLLQAGGISTDAIYKYSRLSYLIYIILFIAFLVELIHSLRHCESCHIKIGGKLISATTIIAAVGMFAEFVNRSYCCFDHIFNSRYLELSYIIPSILCAIAAIVSCFYLLCISATSRGRNLDFRNFGLLHFSVIIYCIMRLISITTSIIDIGLDVDAVLEFLFLVFTGLMWFFYISSIEQESRGRAVALSVCSVMGFAASAVYFIPCFFSAFSSTVNISTDKLITSFCYFTMGICIYFLMREGRGAVKE